VIVRNSRSSFHQFLPPFEFSFSELIVGIANRPFSVPLAAERSSPTVAILNSDFFFVFVLSCFRPFVLRLRFPASVYMYMLRWFVSLVYYRFLSFFPFSLSLSSSFHPLSLSLTHSRAVSFFSLFIAACDVDAHTVACDVDAELTIRDLRNFSQTCDKIDTTAAIIDSSITSVPRS